MVASFVLSRFTTDRRTHLRVLYAYIAASWLWQYRAGQPPPAGDTVVAMVLMASFAVWSEVTHTIAVRTARLASLEWQVQRLNAEYQERHGFLLATLDEENA